MTERTLNASATADVTITTTTETVLVTLPGVSTARAAPVTVEGWAQITTGTGATALTARIRRGTDATGTLIGEANAEQLEAVAGSTEEVYIKAVDAGADLAGASYVLTVQQTAATGNGTGVQSTLSAHIRD